MYIYFRNIVRTVNFYTLNKDNMSVITILLIYILIINLIGFFLMGIDKQKARKHAFRIPEATLFTVALIGGSIGTTAGMFLFRHKTRHWYFRYGMPAIIVIQFLCILFLILGPVKITIF